MKTFISTSVEPGSPDFARSCLIIHDIDFALFGNGSYIDADACVDFASSMNAKEYRYGVLDFKEVEGFLDSCTSVQAEECANNFGDALSSLGSAFPSVRWTLLQNARTFPFSEGSVVSKKKYKQFISTKTNLQLFSQILSQKMGWACIDLRPDENDYYLSSSNRIELIKARASCASMIISKSGWSQNIYGCLGRYVWNPRTSSGYLDNDMPISEIGSQLQYSGIGGLLHYHPGSVVWRTHEANPSQDVANGISAFTDMFTFNDAKNSAHYDAALFLEKSIGFGNFSPGDPREILLNKIVDELKGQGSINDSEHVWHQLNNDVSSSGFWLRKEDKPPRPNPSDFA